MSTLLLFAVFTMTGVFTSHGAESIETASFNAAKTPTYVQMEFPFARGASIQTPGVTTAGETFVRVGAAPQNLKFGSTSLSGAQPGTYAFPEATFNSIGQSPTALKNFGDLPGAAPQYFRTLSPPAGTPIQRGIVPGTCGVRCRILTFYRKLLEWDLGSAPQRHPGGLAQAQLAYGNM
jgi:hypothetical protein